MVKSVEVGLGLKSQNRAEMVWHGFLSPSGLSTIVVGGVSYLGRGNSKMKENTHE